MKIERAESPSDNIVIKDIEGDMGENTRLMIIQQPDGDVILRIDQVKDGLVYPGKAIEFCTSMGGGRHPEIAKELRELVQILLSLK